MAKAIKFKGDTTIDIRPISKNSTYQYDGTGTYTFTITNSFKDAKGADLSGYYSTFYYNLGAKIGKDLVVTSIFSKENGSTKKITTTIKNYFTNEDANSVTYKSYLENFGITTFNITPTTEDQHAGLYSTETALEGPYYVLGTNKNDTNTMGTAATTGQNYFDMKGNDEYIDHMGNNLPAYTYDLAGKDTYSLDGGSILYTHDFAGNDKYSATSEYARLLARDFAGNDEYSIGEYATFAVIDYKGNDKYTVDSNAAAGESTLFTNEISDGQGNDAYNLINAKVFIGDYLGKDTYNIYGDATGVTVNDLLGNDKYNILNATSDDHGTAAGFVANDYAGNDTYNIAKLKYTEAIPDLTYDIIDWAGNDKYNMKKVVVKNKNKTTSIFDLKVQNVAISDIAGNDKYALTISDTNDVASNIFLSDDKGADTYTVKGIETNTVDYLTISDNNSATKDKYNISWTDYLDITDMGGNDVYTLTKCDGSILDKDGNDKYTVNTMANWDVTIQDEAAGNDSYKVTMNAGSFVEIQDGGGNKDSLTVAGARKSDIVFMVDVRSNETYGSSQLLVYNKTNDSLMTVDDFYSLSGDSKAISDFGAGRIETVKAGSTTLKYINKAETYAKFNDELKGVVAGWLTQESKVGVYNILTSNDADAKATLVEIFTTGQVPTT